MAGNKVPQHKRMAAGDKNVGFARGGSVGLPSMGSAKVRVAKPSTGATGLPESPVTVAKRNNGVRGMKKGGKT